MKDARLTDAMRHSDDRAIGQVAIDDLLDLSIGDDIHTRRTFKILGQRAIIKREMTIVAPRGRLVQHHNTRSP